MRISNHECYRTGDINFFAACMAIGIPPQRNAAEVFAEDSGKNYHSFSLATISECGQHRTVEMDSAWNSPQHFKKEFPAHPFTILMDFIQSARGARTKEDWMCKAADFLTITKDAMRRAMRDVKRLEHEAPESPISYLVCFIIARFDAIALAKRSLPSDVAYERNGPGIVLMGGKLPTHQKRELLRKL